MKGTGQPCSVVEKSCTAPAGFGTRQGYGEYKYAKGTGAEYVCHVCGEPVCGGCSYDSALGDKVVRVCFYCTTHD